MIKTPKGAGSPSLHPQTSVTGPISKQRAETQTLGNGVGVQGAKRCENAVFHPFSPGLVVGTEQGVCFWGGAPQPYVLL